MTKTKYRGGRPIVVLTDEQIKEVEEISAYLTCEQIADYFGIDTDTFLAIRKRQSEVFRVYRWGWNIERFLPTIKKKVLIRDKKVFRYYKKSFCVKIFCYYQTITKYDYKRIYIRCVEGEVIYAKTC